jgi:hypothetical protein
VNRARPRRYRAPSAIEESDLKSPGDSSVPVNFEEPHFLALAE